MSLVRELWRTTIFRYFIMGALNTTATFCIYVATKIVLNYQLAYLISYISGILFAYLMSTCFVFNKQPSLRTFIQFPFVYLVQYIVGAILLELFVRVFEWSITFTPLFIIFVTMPLTFLLSRFVLSRP